MDLLGGYDSNSDDSDNESITNVAPPPPLPKPAAPAPTADNNTEPTEPAAATTKASKRGKRLLKLQAVLPEHIWNQLSGTNANLDSDDEDDDKVMKNPRSSRKKQETTQQQTTTATKTKDYSKDADILNLLQALPKSKQGQQKASATAGDKEESSLKKPTILGAAFTTFTVETTKKRTNTVRNIHDEQPSEDEPTPATTTTTSSQPPRSLERAPSPPPPPAPRPQLSVPRPSSVPSSIAPTVRNAAPTVAASSSRQFSNVPPVSSATASYYPVPPDNAYQQQPQSKKSNKHSRKRQMEQMLRSGQMDMATDGMIELDGPSNVYQPPQQQQESQYQSHGIRVVPTARYNVGTGQSTASTQVTGRQRGKHQLNSLLVSAASLEAQRARDPTTGQGQTHRVNAKRKYGW